MGKSLRILSEIVRSERANRLAVTLMLSASVAGWDGDEVAPDAKLSELIDERDEYFAALADAARYQDVPGEHIKDMIAALDAAWNEIPAIQDLIEASLVAVDKQAAMA